MGLRWQTRLDLNPQQVKWHTQGAMTVPMLKKQGVGTGPNPRNLHPFPKIVGIILPLISMWNCPAYKNHSVCGVCFSLNLNKFTSYLSLYLSPNCFYDETVRTWASLSPEARCVTSTERPWVQLSIWVAQFQSHSPTPSKVSFWAWFTCSREWNQFAGNSFKGRNIYVQQLHGQASVSSVHERFSDWDPRGCVKMTCCHPPSAYWALESED